VKDEASNKEALAYCEAKIDEDPADGVFWILKGHCHYRLDDLEEAARSYKQAIMLGEVSCHTNFFLAGCLIELGRLEEAVGPLEAQLEITPEHLDALFLLGLCFHVLDARDKSDPLLEKVREIDMDFYEQMFAEYAEVLASHSTDPMMKEGLVQAARTLRRKE
jgi:tetratricopeptide (TPR) repeat protein